MSRSTPIKCLGREPLRSSRCRPDQFVVSSELTKLIRAKNKTQTSETKPNMAPHENATPGQALRERVVSSAANISRRVIGRAATLAVEVATPHLRQLPGNQPEPMVGTAGQAFTPPTYRNAATQVEDILSPPQVVRPNIHVETVNSLQSEDLGGSSQDRHDAFEILREDGQEQFEMFQEANRPDDSEDSEVSDEELDEFELNEADDLEDAADFRPGNYVDPDPQLIDGNPISRHRWRTSRPLSARNPFGMQQLQFASATRGRATPLNVSSVRVHRTPAMRSTLSNPAETPVPLELDLDAGIRDRLPRRDSYVTYRELRACEQLAELGNDLHVPPVLSTQERQLVETATVNPSGPNVHAVQQVVRQGGMEYGTLPRIRGEMIAGFKPNRAWIASQRHTLSSRQYQEFVASATDYRVLGKGDKLAPIEIKQDDGKLLISVKNLRCQLRDLEQHWINHDIVNVMTIVVPVDVKRSPTLTGETHNLFRTFGVLHAANVAISCYWYNQWYDDHMISAHNLILTFDSLKRNTDPDLWRSCIEDYNSYAADMQGGPLMLFLLLQKIFGVGEPTLVELTSQIRAFKLTSLVGENVDEAVEIILAVKDIFEQCSLGGTNWVPRDLDETGVKIFQTSSCAEFNEIFQREEFQARAAADKYNSTAKFPSLIKETCALAKNSYKRLTSPTADRKWVQADKQGAAYNYSTPSVPKTPASSEKSDSSDRSKNPCWNCGVLGCIPSKCPKPRDEARIKKNKEAYMKKKKARSGDRRGKQSSGKGGKPRRDSQGRILKVNKNGAYVVDQKAEQRRQQQREASQKQNSDKKDKDASSDDKALTAAVSKLTTTVETLSANVASSASPAPAAPATYVASAEQIRGALASR